MTIATIDRIELSIGILAVLSCLALVFAFVLVAGLLAASWCRLTVAPERNGK